MRTNMLPGTKFALVIGLAASAFVCAGARPVSAQNDLTPLTTEPKAALRIGAYLPSNKAIKRQIGQALPNAGFDYYISRNGAGGHNIVSIDYMERGSGNHHLQMIPVTFGQTNHQYNDGQYSKTYFGYGVGAYFTTLDITDSLGFDQRNHTTLFGGYINLGADLSDSLFLDARYHITSSAGSANPGGLQVTVGVRF